MKKFDQKEIVIWILALVPLIITAFLFPSLPDRIPMHWNAAGDIDSWGGRISAFYIPLMIIGINLLMKFLPKIDPRRKNYERFGKAYYAIRLVLVLFLGLISGIILYSAFHPTGVATGIIVPAGVGVLFAVIGNFMPKFKHNYFVGVKTPWTLANEEVWRKTHRLAGVIWFWGGLILAACAFIIPETVYFIVFLVGVMVLAFVPMGYSYYVYYKMNINSEK